MEILTQHQLKLQPKTQKILCDLFLGGGEGEGQFITVYAPALKTQTKLLASSVKYKKVLL